MDTVKLLSKLIVNYNKKLKESIKNKNDTDIIFYKRKYNETLTALIFEVTTLENSDQLEIKYTSDQNKRSCKNKCTVSEEF
jgi:hypothetical protein